MKLSAASSLFQLNRSSSPRQLAQFVVRKDIRALLRLRQMLNPYARHFNHAFSFGCFNPAMPCDYSVVFIYQHRIDKTKLRRLACIFYLLVRMRSSVVGVWY